MSWRNFSGHALWLVGFRPFFLLAIVSGTLLPIIWSALLLGWVQLPADSVPSIQWHAHEMLFGFGWAVLGGFLLTASKNWLKIRGMHGNALIFAVTLWLIERAIFWSFPQVFHWPLIPRLLVLNASVLFIGGYVITTLIKYRKQDSFSDNYFFVIGLCLLLVSKSFMLSPQNFAQGYSLAVGIFRLAFAVMFERTITQFMKNAMGENLIRTPYLDLPIKFLVLLAAFQAFLPTTISAILLTAAAVVLLIRFLMWKPQVAFRRFEIGVMYVGYLGLTIHLMLEAAKLMNQLAVVGTISIHVFTFFCMGLIIPAMLIRICQGHTGRKLQFTSSDRFAIGLMGAAAFCRLMATQLWPERYLLWSALSAIGWSLCFLIVGIRLAPFLWQPRIDGRVH